MRTNIFYIYNKIQMSTILKFKLADNILKGDSTGGYENT